VIKVVFQLNSLGFGGTEKSILTFIEHFDSKKVQAYVFFNSDKGSPKFHLVRFLAKFSQKYRKKYNEKYIRNFSRFKQFQEALNGRLEVGNGLQAFYKYILKVKPHVIHLNRGLEEEFYTKQISLMPSSCKIVETNIFGKTADQNYLRRLSGIIFSSYWLRGNSEWADTVCSMVLYLPVKRPRTLAEQGFQLRNRLLIPKDAIVLGRLSRPELDDGEFIRQVFAKVRQRNPGIFLVSLGSSNRFREVTVDDPSIIHLPPTIVEEEIATFLMAIDLFLHFRVEGETFGLNIAEAMSYSLPVVTHESSVDNAQIELVTRYETCGVVVSKADPDEYAFAVSKLIDEPDTRRLYSQNSKNVAFTQFNPNTLTRKLEDFYEKIISS
jgi:glycosyltransferase involved in cell wall biosynthesis